LGGGVEGLFIVVVVEISASDLRTRLIAEEGRD
jgi:hypothetical protein